MSFTVELSILAEQTTLETEAGWGMLIMLVALPVMWLLLLLAGIVDWFQRKASQRRNKNRKRRASTNARWP